MGGKINKDAYAKLIQEDIDWLDNLREIVEKTNAQIVISSTWRITHPVEQFLEMFKIYGWDNAPVIDKTERLGRRRGYEIQKYLNDHPEITSYVILDDNTDMLDEQKEHFVKTDEKVGLTIKNANKAIDILGRINPPTLSKSYEKS